MVNGKVIWDGFHGKGLGQISKDGGFVKALLKKCAMDRESSYESILL